MLRSVAERGCDAQTRMSACVLGMVSRARNEPSACSLAGSITAVIHHTLRPPSDKAGRNRRHVHHMRQAETQSLLTSKLAVDAVLPVIRNPAGRPGRGLISWMAQRWGQRRSVVIAVGLEAPEPILTRLVGADD